MGAANPPMEQVKCSDRIHLVRIDFSAAQPAINFIRRFVDKPSTWIGLPWCVVEPNARIDLVYSIAAVSAIAAHDVAAAEMNWLRPCEKPVSW